MAPEGGCLRNPGRQSAHPVGSSVTGAQESPLLSAKETRPHGSHAQAASAKDFGASRWPVSSPGRPVPSGPSQARLCTPAPGALPTSPTLHSCLLASPSTPLWQADPLSIPSLPLLDDLSWAGSVCSLPSPSLLHSSPLPLLSPTGVAPPEPRAPGSPASCSPTVAFLSSPGPQAPGLQGPADQRGETQDFVTDHSWAPGSPWSDSHPSSSCCEPGPPAPPPHCLSPSPPPPLCALPCLSFSPVLQSGALPQGPGALPTSSLPPIPSAPEPRLSAAPRAPRFSACMYPVTCASARFLALVLFSFSQLLTDIVGVLLLLQNQCSPGWCGSVD